MTRLTKSVYEGPFCEHSILKRGKRWGDFMPEVLEDISCVKEEKKTDVLNLLASRGVSNEIQVIYASWLQSNNEISQSDTDED